MNLMEYRIEAKQNFIIYLFSYIFVFHISFRRRLVHKLQSIFHENRFFFSLGTCDKKK